MALTMALLSWASCWAYELMVVTVEVAHQAPHQDQVLQPIQVVVVVGHVVITEQMEVMEVQVL
jgi:hypothetical protein